MKNLFSSPPTAVGLTKIYSQIDMLLNEQRKQRADLAQLLRMSAQIVNDIRLYKQSDDYYQTHIDDDQKDIPEETT